MFLLQLVDICLKKKRTKGFKTSKGYLAFDLCKRINGKKTRKTVFVHRLVAEAFIPNPDNKPQINHKDGNKQNNCVDNLEWCTNGENQQHAIKMGLNGGFNHPNHNRKLTYEDVRYIKKYHNPKVRGYGMTSLAKKFGVCEGTIKQILDGRSYKFIE